MKKAQVIDGPIVGFLYLFFLLSSSFLFIGGGAGSDIDFFNTTTYEQKSSGTDYVIFNTEEFTYEFILDNNELKVHFPISRTSLPNSESNEQAIIELQVLIKSCGLNYCSNITIDHSLANTRKDMIYSYDFSIDLLSEGIQIYYDTDCNQEIALNTRYVSPFFTETVLDNNLHYFEIENYCFYKPIDLGIIDVFFEKYVESGSVEGSTHDVIGGGLWSINNEAISEGKTVSINNEELLLMSGCEYSESETKQVYDLEDSGCYEADGLCSAKDFEYLTINCVNGISSCYAGAVSEISGFTTCEQSATQDCGGSCSGTFDLSNQDNTNCLSLTGEWFEDVCSGTFACSGVVDESFCETQVCDWKGAGACEGTIDCGSLVIDWPGTSSACEVSSFCEEKVLGLACVKDSDSSTCSGMSSDETSCKLGNGCSWIDANCGGTCSCSTKSTETSCTGASGCSWNVGDCTAAYCSGTGTCSAQDNEAECDALDCSWDTTYSCSGDLNTYCGGLDMGSNSECDISPYCEEKWIFWPFNRDCVKTSECSSLSSSNCETYDCSLSSEDDCTGSKTCTGLTETNCGTADNCAWNAENCEADTCSGTCSCSSKTNPNSCNGVTGCSWNYDTCSGTLTCSNLGTNFPETNSDCDSCVECKESFSSIYCDKKTEDTVCASINTLTECTSHGCSWLDGCIGGENNDCSSITVESDCDLTNSCSWIVEHCEGTYDLSAEITENDCTGYDEGVWTWGAYSYTVENILNGYEEKVECSWLNPMIHLKLKNKYYDVPFRFEILFNGEEVDISSSYFVIQQQGITMDSDSYYDTFENEEWDLWIGLNNVGNFEECDNGELKISLLYEGTINDLNEDNNVIIKNIGWCLING